MTVVKADAYGHGLRQIAALLMQAGTDIFGVANLNEARDIRAVGRGWPSRLKGWQTQNRMRGDLYAQGLLVSGGARLLGPILTTGSVHGGLGVHRVGWLEWFHGGEI